MTTPTNIGMLLEGVMTYDLRKRKVEAVMTKLCIHKNTLQPKDGEFVS